MKKTSHTSLGIQSVGKRMTKARREIIALLERAKEPLSIQMLVPSVSANETSVYRTIRLLHTEGIVEEIGYPDGSKRYAIGGHHHHHIICTGCGYTEHMPCGKERVPAVEAHSRFKKIDEHVVTYYGRCASCA